MPHFLVLFGESDRFKSTNIFPFESAEINKLFFINIKFVFSKKATKIDEIFTVDLTLAT